MPPKKRYPEGQHQYTARFPLDLWPQLEEAAKAEGRSVNEQLTQLVREWLNARGKTKRARREVD